MPFAAALSEHPVAAAAAGEVIGTILEKATDAGTSGVEPDLVVVFVSSAHTEFVGEITAAVRAVLRPGTLVGATASAVVGGRREVEEVPALSLWAAWASPMTPVRLEARTTDVGTAVVGLPADLPAGAVVLVLADPFTFPADALVRELAALRPDVSLIGGLASAPPERGGNALVLDAVVFRDGAVGVVVPREHLVGPVVSQGCRPVGDALTVTAADRHYLLELGGRPAFERLTELTETVTPADKALLAGGVHLGVVIDEARDDFGRGDFLVRTILGGDRERGVLAVGDEVPVGTTVQFQVRDAASADEDLNELLEGVRGDGALLFTCNGRGRSLFGVDDHDAEAVVDHVGSDAVAGMFCSGEIGPVGGRTYLHGFTASVLVFTDD